MRPALAALAVSVALVAAYVAAGGGTFRPTPTADPCAPRERPQSDDALEGPQAAFLAALDGAACELGTSREEMLLAVLDRRRPPGASDDDLEDALVAGVRRAREEDRLGGPQATAIELGLRVGGAGALLRLLMAGEG